MNKPLEKLHRFLSKRCEPVTAAAIREQLISDEGTVTQLLLEARQTYHVVKIGQTRNARYLATVDAYGTGIPIPLYQIDSTGTITPLAKLLPVVHGGMVIQPANTAATAAWLLGDNGLGHYAALPYFIHDLRPQGFLGRREAHRLAQDGEYPADPQHWQPHHIVKYLLSGSHDLSGNMVLGERAVQRLHMLSTPDVVTPFQFPYKAKAVLKGQKVGSSAGGEQPKFTAYTEHGHTIIKFASQTDSLATQRWCDLLIAEHIALELLRTLGVPAPVTYLHEVEHWVFLESVRFDRAGVRGRSPLISLAAVSTEFVGCCNDWQAVAESLYLRDLIDKITLKYVLLAQRFGHWIANTDMHLGNLSLVPTNTGFKLAPLYDMTPMHYAPVHGELLQLNWQLPVQTGMDSSLWYEAMALAQLFWGRLRDDGRISADFRKIAADVVNIIK